MTDVILYFPYWINPNEHPSKISIEYHESCIGEMRSSLLLGAHRISYESPLGLYQAWALRASTLARR